MKLEYVKKETIIRTACLALTMINAGLEMFHKSPLPISNDMIREIVTYGFLVGSSLWAWWKNNSFTFPAILADEHLNALRQERKERKCEE